MDARLEPLDLDDRILGGGYRHQEIAITNRSLRRVDDLDWNAAGFFQVCFNNEGALSRWAVELDMAQLPHPGERLDMGARLHAGA